ncbi:VQ motif-containing protein 4-like [Cornus florida]|uniref:VQ motif-containing protein 4-like n=1 Tax=Cornus florida TaxID=4283 RepID=UPI0028A204D1|nr:VQ motif-containing protein 4-like [Cornus florida]
MEITSTSRAQERENPSPINSPHSNGSSSNSNGVQFQTPKPISRCEVNPYPTTFVQADTTSFKQVVQMLTGSSDTAKHVSKTPHSDPPPSKNCIPPIRSGQKKQGFKLYERRNQLKNSLMISPSMPGFAQNPGFSPRKPEILSPSILDFPSLVLSPVTPLIEEALNKSSPSTGNSSEEERAIAEKGFYMHPSPATTPRDSEPRLLPLFPVSSPRVPGSSS